MITIVIVVSSLDFGGAERQIIQLVNASQHDPLIKYYIVSLSNVVPLAEKLLQPNQLHIIQKRFKFDLSVPFRLAAFLRAVNANIVHGYLFDAEIAARIAGRLANVNVIFGSERNTNYHIKLSHKIAYRLTKSMRDYCIANSSSGAQFNAKELGYPEKHYHIIYNGVDSELFKPRPRIEALQALGLDPELFWVGTFASFKERKNHPMLLRAAALLLKEHPDIRYVWVGDELAGDQQGSHDYKLSILRMIETLGLKNHIHLLGNRSNVQSIYPACDLTVLPSRIEGTPNVALESMASGVPVIATDVSDNTYIIPDGIAGRIVKLNDDIALASAISELKCNNKLRVQFATNARNWVEQQFSLSQLASKTNTIYSDLIINRA